MLGLRHPDAEAAWASLSRLERLMTWPTRCNCWAVTESGRWALGMRAAFSGNF